MMIVLASLAFAGQRYVPCSVSDFPKEVAKVWHLADHGPFVAQSMVNVGNNVPSDIAPGLTISYEIMVTFDKSYVVLGAWFQLDQRGPILPLNVMMTRDGSIINAVDAEACEGKRALAVNFFAQLPGTLTYPVPPRPTD